MTPTPDNKWIAVLSNIPPDQRENIAPEWIELWSDIEIWYGDIQKKETGRQFLERMQSKFSLIPKTPSK